MALEDTVLFQEMTKRATHVPGRAGDLLRAFDDLRSVLIEHGKYIVELFPEYTPHDQTNHWDHLFSLADRILGKSLYDSLKPTELMLLGFGLYSHDWGMAVSRGERNALETGESDNFLLLPNEPRQAQEDLAAQQKDGYRSDVAWRDYLRRTHGLRSGARLRRQLEPLGQTFAEAVAKLAEGHTRDIAQIRDTNRYPVTHSVCGEIVNLAALAIYIRIIDLLDIGDDRTPYALWKFVEPKDSISSMEWKKHRALSPVAVDEDASPRKIVVSGLTNDHSVYAALADLANWVDTEFEASMTTLRGMRDKYALDLDSRIKWNIQTAGFEPILMRFEIDRREVLGLLGRELYGNDALAFVRELLQNSVDAIDARQALLGQDGQTLKGEIRVKMTSDDLGLHLIWSDNGIGMDLDIVKSYFSQVGRSWYRSRTARSVNSIKPISQFGLGILSCFSLSDSLIVRTRMDPLIGRSPQGLVMQIPSRNNHFRVSRDGTLPTGTSVEMRVPREVANDVTANAVISALERIARFVSHDVVVEVEGGREPLRLGAGARESALSDIGNHVPAILGIRGNAAENLEARTRRVSFAIGGPPNEYAGYYSALIPNQPKEAINDIDSSLWRLEGVDVDLDDVVVEDEQAIFVKGIRAGRVGPSVAGRQSGVSIDGAYSSWIAPTLLINLKDPHAVEFDLGRNNCRLIDRPLIDDIWRDIAAKLKAEVFDDPVATLHDRAVILGAASVFGGVPNATLRAMLKKEDIPVLVLRQGQGLVWAAFQDVVNREEILEAPYELHYAAKDQEVTSLDLGGWKGKCALFPGERFTTVKMPWLGPTLDLTFSVLKEGGWRPHGIRMVEAPTGEDVPLVCRVWRQCPPNQHRTERTLKGLYREAPELVSFPEEFSQFAAFGSRFWNIDHPKTTALVQALNSLQQRTKNHELTPSHLRLVRYLTSNTNYGFVVPSRISARRLALETPNGLAAIAAAEGICAPIELTQDDFAPGTLAAYHNPYHYDLRRWRAEGSGFGAAITGQRRSA